MIPSFFRPKVGIRNISHTVFWLFIVFGVLLQLGWIDIRAHDQEWFLSGMMYLSALGMLVPWLLSAISKRITGQVVALIEILAAVAMILSWIGSFGPYRWGFGYDSFVHFTASLLLAIIIVSLAYAVFPRVRPHAWAVILVVATLTLFGGVINELFELFGDQVFGTMMYGELGQPTDTIRDYWYDITGALTGSMLGVLFRDRIIKLL